MKIDEANYLKKISKLRNLSSKEKPLITSKEYIARIVEGIKVVPGALYNIGIVREDLLPDKEIERAIKQEFGSNAIKFTTKLEIVRIIEKSDEDIMLLCQHYYQWLENLVNDWENQVKFS